jgi:predicted 3-demethylubiquinone-9 3-methyltransferase (glyoxalase superfamily)
MFKLTEAISFQISCSTQQEIDHFWNRLSAGGEEGPCGWLKDRFGLSWQVVPERLGEMLADSDPQKVQRVTHAFLQMKKFDLAALEAAYEGREAGVTRRG